MSYLDFVFDLQRFGDVDLPVEITVDLTNVKDVLTTGTKYLVKNGDNVKWQDATAAGEETLVATLSGGVLDIVKTVTGDSVTLTGITEEELLASGLTIQAKTASGTAASSTGYTLKDGETTVGTITGTVLVMNAVEGEVWDTAGVATISQNTGTGTVTATMTAAAAAADSIITCYNGFSSDVTETVKITLDTDDEDNPTGTATIVRSGDEASVHTGVKVEGAVFTSTKGQITVLQDKGGADGALRTVTPADFADSNVLTLPASTAVFSGDDTSKQSVSKFFAVKADADGKLTVTAANAVDSAAIGYLQVTYDKDNGDRPSAAITFVSDFEGTKSAWLLTGGALAIDATAIDTIGGVAVARITVDDSIKSSEGTVNITKVPATADVVVGSTTYTDSHALAETDTDKNVVTYVTTYDVSSAAKAANINLAALSSLSLSDGATRYFKITAAEDKVNKHGKKVYTVSQDATTLATGAEESTITGEYGAFKVTYTAANDGKYAIEFVKGTTNVNLTEAGWANITVDATGITKGEIAIKQDSTGSEDSADATTDVYTVSAPAGVKVTATAVEHGAENSVKVTRTSAGTLSLGFGGSDTAITIPAATNPAAEVVEYWKVESDDGSGVGKDGNPKITITKVAPEGDKGDTYLTVTRSEKGDVTIAYTNGKGIALSSITGKDGALKVAVNGAGIAAGNTLTITDTASTGTAVDFNVTGLAYGVSVVGNTAADSIAYDNTSAEAFSNDIVVDLSKVTAEKNYYKVAVATAVETGSTTGCKKITLGAAYAAAELTNSGAPAAGSTYVLVDVATLNGAKTYTVSYVKGDSGKNLSQVAAGKTTIKAGSLTKADSLVVTKDDTINGYVIDGVISGGIASIKENSADISTSTTSSVNYVATNVLAEGASIDLVSSGTKVYEVTKGDAVKGVTTYSIGEAKPLGSVTSNTSYFKVSYDATTKTAKVEYVEVTGGITLADFSSKLSTAVKVDGSALPLDAATVVLTDDTKGAIEYAVTGLPASVTTVTHGDGTGDSVEYKATYKFAADATLTLSKTEGTVIYKVTAEGKDNGANGVYTCSIGDATAVADAAALATHKSENYFKAVTEPNGNVTVTYHVAEDPEDSTATKPVKLTLDTPATGVEDALTVTVDPTGAATGTKAAPVEFTFGEATGARITYSVEGLDKGQTAKASTEAGVNDTVKVKYDTSYEVVYQDSSANSKTAIDLDSTLVPEKEGDAAVTKYYTVTTKNGLAEGAAGGDVSDKDKGRGVNVITVSGPLDSPVSNSSYIQVTYKSPYVISVTYVNPNGESNSLTKEGIDNIIINADGLTSGKGKTVDTIDITENSGGNYNGVNFALTNVPVAVKNIPGKEDGKDTVSYKTAAVLADDAALTLDSTQFTAEVDTVYYAVKATTDKDESGNTICELEKDTSGNTVSTTTKPLDTVNYFAVKKGSSGYTVSYHMAEGAGGLGLTSSSVLGVDVGKLAVAASSTTDEDNGVTTEAPGSVTIADESGIVVNVTNAKGGVTGDSTNPVDSISYVTDNFAWTPGTYYVKVAKGKESTIAAATADDKTGITVPGAEDTYAKFTVTKVTTGTGNNKKEAYQLVIGDNYLVAADTTGVMGNTNTKVGTAVSAAPAELTIALPTSIASFDAGDKGYKAITGVNKDDVLTNVDNSTKVVTGDLVVGDEITVSVNGADDAAAKTFTAGAAGALTVYSNGSVLSGAVKLDAAAETVSEKGGNKIVLEVADPTKDKNGVVVTFKANEAGTASTVASITGLDTGDEVAIYNGTTLKTRYRHETVGNTDYIVKVDFTGNVTTKTYAAPSTGDVLSLNYLATTSQAVGGELSLATVNSTYYADAGSSTTAAFTLAGTAAGTAQKDHYYVAVKVGSNANEIAGLTVLKGNDRGLLDATTAYTGTITIPASLFGSTSVVKYAGTKITSATADSAFKVAFTGVKAGSKFKYLDSDDTITTDTLADNTAITITYKGGSNGATDVNATYTTKGEQALTFKGNACTGGTVTLAAGSTLVAADGKTISYTANGTDQNDGVTVVFGEEGITSVTGLSKGEKVTLTAKDGTVTVYEASTASGKEFTDITRTVTGTDGKTVTTKLTATGTDAATQSNILEAAEAADNVDNIVSNFAWPTAPTTTKTSGYFEATASGTPRTFNVAPQTDATISLEANTVVVKAEAEFVNGTSAADGVKLTLTPMVYNATTKELASTAIYGDTVTVNAAAAGGKLVYTADSSKSYMVAFTNVAAGSTITTKTVGDTIETAALGKAATDTITVNGKTITSKGTSNTIGLYIASGGEICATNGTILLDGSGVTAAYNTTAGTGDKAHKDAITYTGKTGVTAGTDTNDGVEASFTNGELTGLKDLEVGESITITEPGGKTTKYEAAGVTDTATPANTVIWKTVTGSSNASENGTWVASISDGAEAISSVTYNPANAYKALNDFSTKYTDGKTTGYFLVNEVTDGTDTVKTATIADMAKDTEIATYKDAGKTVVKAVIGSDGTLTLTKATVGITGAITDVSGGAFGTKDVEALSMTVKGGQTIKYTKQTGIKNIAITGAGKDSVFTGLVDGDTVTTAALAITTTTSGNTTTTTADTVQVNGVTYTVGANNTTMSFNGGAVVAGTFNIAAFNDGTDAAKTFTTTSTDATTKVKTVSNLVYTAGSTNTDGANVKVENGKVVSVTGLNLGEQVSYKTTITNKDGSTSITDTTYKADATAIDSGAYKGMIAVTKTEVKDGVTTIYTKNFSSDSQNVADSSGWAVYKKEVTTYFNFGEAATTTNAYTDTGYFAATLSTATDKTADDYGKYTAAIVKQSSGKLTYVAPTTDSTTGKTVDNNYYLTATASKATDGTVTLSDMKLVHLESTGTLTEVTGKEVYSVAITAPTSGKIALSEHSFIANITLESDNADYTFSGLNDDDKVTATGLKDGKTIVVNDKKYTASGDNTVVIVGKTIESGKVVVTTTELTAAADGTKIAYTAGSTATDGVIVAFDADGGITSIKDLEAGETVTVTAKDGTVTTYKRDDTTPTAPVFTKTVKSADGKQTATWTYTNSGAIDTTATTSFDVTAQSYGVSKLFAWPTDSTKTSVGYFDAFTSANNATIQAEPTAGNIVVSGANKVVRAEVAKSTDGYTITSLQVLQGTTLKDVTGDVYADQATADSATKVTVKVALPSVDGIKTIALAKDAIQLPTATTANPVVGRNVTLNISGVTAGQTVTGLADDDTVTTANLAAEDVITVGSDKFKAAVAGAVLTVYGDGTAKSGSFEVGSGFSVSTKDSSGTVTEVVASKGNGAMAAVSGGQVTSINRMNANDTVVVTKTTKDGVVTIDTYTATAGSEAGQVLVTRKSVADGVTTEATATIGDNGDALSGSYTIKETGNSIESAFDWTMEGGSGYFALTDAEGTLLSATKTLEIGAQKKLNIGATDKGKIYAKVELSADNAIKAISLVQIGEDGTPNAYTGTLSEKFNVAITAPTEAVTADFTAGAVRNANIGNISITDVALKSVVILKAGDTMETVPLTPSTLANPTEAAKEVVKVNNTDFAVGASTILKFTANASGNAVVRDGVFKAAVGTYYAAGADNIAGVAGTTDADNVTITVATNPATITVKNGVVTGISGQTTVGDSVTTAVGANSVAYTLADLSGTKVYNAVVTGTDANVVALSKGSTVTVGGTLYTSGADNNTVVVAGSKFQSGTLSLAAGTVSLTGADTSVATDDVTVTYTKNADGSTALVTPVVTFKDGAVAAVSGLGVGDSIQVVTADSDATKAKTVTYTMTTATQVTKEEWTGTKAADDSNVTKSYAYISSGKDLVSASYFGAETGTDTTAATLPVGQFNWGTTATGTVSGRTMGYFKMSSKTPKDAATIYTTTVKDQPNEEAVVASASKTTATRYLVASVDEEGVLTINAMDIDYNGTMTAKDVTKDFDDTSVVTIQAPADKALKYDKSGAKFAVNITKVADGSKINGLDAKDKVTTGTLTAESVVTVNGNAYVAGANGVLQFVGSGSDTATAPATADNKASLYSGTIVLGPQAYVDFARTTVANTALISGSEADTDTDDITVTNSGADNVKVTVKGGKITSIKGLTSLGATVTVANTSATVNRETRNNVNILYKVEATGMVSRTIFTDVEGTGNQAGVLDSGEALDKEFLTVPTSGEIFTGSYKQATLINYETLNYANTGAKHVSTVYYHLANLATDANAATLVTKDTAGTTLGDTNVGGTQFIAEPGGLYLKVTATTTAAGVTTLATEVLEANATGSISVKKKGWETDYTGTLTIDGSAGMSAAADAAYDSKYGVVNYKLPASKTFKIAATNVSYKSSFTNLDAAKDAVTTAPITAATDLAGGNYNIYYLNGTYTETRTLKVKGNGVKVTTDANGKIATLSGLATRNESVTLTETTATGTTTTVYQVTNANGTVKRTVTDANGKQVIDYAAGIAEGTDILVTTGDTAVTWTSAIAASEAAKIVSDFNYTLDKTPVGYFKVASNGTTTQVKSIAYTDTGNYIAVTVNADGVVSSVAQVQSNGDASDLKMAVTDSSFSGKLTLKAPTGVALTFNRTALDTNMADATIAITGAIAGSNIQTDHNGDTVTTGKLAKAAAVTVNEGYFTAVNGGTLGFKVADVNINGETLESKTVLTSGTVSLNFVGGNEGLGFVYAGDNLVEYTQAGVAADGITVTAVTSGNKTTFTVGGLGESESFKVNGQTFQRSGKTLICTYTDEAGDKQHKVLALTGTSVKSSQLDITKSAWKDGKETFTTNEDGSKTSDYGKVTVNLATALSRYNADKRAKVPSTVAATGLGNTTNYSYILDTYVTSTTAASKTKALAAEVVRTNGVAFANDGWQTEVGQVTVTAVLNAITNGIDYTYGYTANTAIGQAITVAKDWVVTGSDFDDTIKGAASGENYIYLTNGGNDTVTLGNAIEHVYVDHTKGRTEISGFSAKDYLTTTQTDYAVQLDKTGNVYLFEDADGDKSYDTDEQGLTLKKASGVAVKLNGTATYFGKGDNTAGSFTYVEGAHYYGNASGKNTLSVTTDKTKATATTLGDDVTVDLTKSIYTNIQNVNASKSTNRVVLTAAATGSTLTGGTYQSTLKGNAGADTLNGGTGQDVFWFEALAGKDTISSYTSGKDSIYIGGTTDLLDNGYTVTASGKDVVISNGESSVTVKNGVNVTKAVSISKDGAPASNVTNTKTGTVKTTVDYYVGTTGKANNFTKFDETAYYIGSTGTDTLTLDAAAKGATIDLNTSKYQSIDVINASKVSYNSKKDVGYTDTVAPGNESATSTTKAVGANITASTAEGSAVTITGTKFADTITCGTATTINYARGNGADVIKNFSIDDLLNFTGLRADDIASIQSAVNSFNKNGGDLKFTIGGSQVTVNTSGVSTLTLSGTGAKRQLSGK